MTRWVSALPLLLLALPACGGYRELKQEIEQYSPPEIYQDSAREVPRELSERSADGEEFAAQMESLREQRDRWSRSLGNPDPAEVFWTPEPALLQDLSAAVGDASVAADALSGEFTLGALETLVWLRNPGIAAAERQVGAALQRYDQASNLDAILRQYQAFTEAVMPGVGPMKGREPAQMKTPYPDMVALKGQVVTQEVAATRQGLEIARRDALTMARKAYWNLGFLAEALRLTGEMERLLGDLLAVATTRYESGKASFQDVVKVQIRLDTLVEERNTLQEKRANTHAVVRRVLDLESSVRLGEPGESEPSTDVPELNGLQALAQERRQELRRMDAMIGKMERMVAMGETRIHADPTLNLSLAQGEEVMATGTARMREPFAVTTNASMGAGTPIKAWYGSGEAYLRETREKTLSLKEKRRDMAAMVQLEVRRSWFAVDRAVREYILYRDSVVELSETALDVSTRGYETGGVMFADVIVSYTEWLKAHLGEARRRADIGVARAELTKSVGVDGSWERN